MTKTIILIPSRLGALRLPNKPLLKINNKSLINHVYEVGQSTNIGEVYVATGDKEIFEDVINNNGKSILTNKKHLTGTDRIFEAFEHFEDFGIFKNSSKNKCWQVRGVAGKAMSQKMSIFEAFQRDICKLRTAANKVFLFYGNVSYEV